MVKRLVKKGNYLGSAVKKTRVRERRPHPGLNQEGAGSPEENISPAKQTEQSSRKEGSYCYQSDDARITLGIGGVKYFLGCKTVGGRGLSITMIRKLFRLYSRGKVKTIIDPVRYADEGRGLDQRGGRV